jgi:hypothetical protein
VDRHGAQSGKLTGINRGRRPRWAYLEVLGGIVAATAGDEPKGKAMAVLSTMVGALTLSRAVNDPDLAQAFLDAAVEQVREAVAARKDGRRPGAPYRPRSGKTLIEISLGEHDVERAGSGKPQRTRWNNEQLRWKMGPYHRGIERPRS